MDASKHVFAIFPLRRKGFSGSTWTALDSNRWGMAETEGFEPSIPF